MTITLPNHVFEDQLPALLRKLAGAAQSTDITVDMAKVHGHYIPAAVVAILATAQRWKAEGKNLHLRGWRESKSSRYLQRIDFFEQLGLKFPEDFARHQERGLFLPVKKLSFGQPNVGPISTELASCVVPDGGATDDTFRLVQYVAGELLSNAKQHSRGTAFVSAQYFKQRDLVRIGIADNGMGIRSSFDGTNTGSHINSDAAALEAALQPGVSSALERPHIYGRPDNRGLGLSMISELTRQALGRMIIASGSGRYSQIPEEISRFQEAPEDIFSGTLLSLSLKRDEILNYSAMHREALDRLDLRDSSADDTVFD